MDNNVMVFSPYLFQGFAALCGRKLCIHLIMEAKACQGLVDLLHCMDSLRFHLPVS